MTLRWWPIALRGLRIPIAWLRLPVGGRRVSIALWALRRLSVALRRSSGTGRSPTAALHQNFTDEPQPQLPVTFGLLNLKPEPCTPST